MEKVWINLVDPLVSAADPTLVSRDQQRVKGAMHFVGRSHKESSTGETLLWKPHLVHLKALEKSNIYKQKILADGGKFGEKRVLV